MIQLAVLGAALAAFSDPQNPYFSRTDRKGAYHIRNVPPGRYKLTFFHEKLKSKSIDVGAEAGKDVTVDFTELEKKP